MRYVPYHRLDGRPNLILDGSPTDGTTRCVTHWPGYPPPAEIAADLSAQMAFRLLEHPDLVPAGTDLVSNNHFDQDGLVSILALTDPDAVSPRRRLLEDVACAGDFGRSHTREAACISMALAAMAMGRDPDLSPLPDAYDDASALLYDEALRRLVPWCDDPDRARPLWADEDDTLTASDIAFESGNVTLSEDVDLDLAVVTVGPEAPTSGGHRFGGNWLDGLHPMAVNNRTERVVVATVHGRHYRVEHRYETWVQLVSRRPRARRDLQPLATRLQDDERGDAIWRADPVGTLTPVLTSGDGDSSIDADRFVTILSDHLRSAPAAWDPYRSS